MSRREQIKMSAAEVAAFLAHERVVACASVGAHGWPHVMPLWYVLRGHSAGELYAELRGVMLECDAVIHRDIETVARLGAEIMLRNATPRGEEPLEELPDEGRALIDAQAPKRVGLEFVERRRASWDHRKLGGVY